MKEWYEFHVDNPYPTEAERKEMSIRGSISVNQVKAWFANKRNRTNNTRPKNQTLKMRMHNSCILKEYMENSKSGLQLVKAEQECEEENSEDFRCLLTDTDLGKSGIKSTKNILKEHLSSKDTNCKNCVSSNDSSSSPSSSFSFNNSHNNNKNGNNPLMTNSYVNNYLFKTPFNPTQAAQPSVSTTPFDYILQQQQQTLQNLYFQSLMRHHYPTTYYNNLNATYNLLSQQLDNQQHLQQQHLQQQFSTPQPIKPQPTASPLTPPVTPISNHIPSSYIYNPHINFYSQQQQQQQMQFFYDNRMLKQMNEINDNKPYPQSPSTTQTSPISPNPQTQFDQIPSYCSQNVSLNGQQQQQNKYFANDIFKKNSTIFDNGLSRVSVPVSVITPVASNLYPDTTKYLQTCIDSQLQQNQQNRNFTNEKMEKWSIKSHPKLAHTLLDETVPKINTHSSLLTSKTS